MTEWYTLTKMDVNAFRQCDRIVVRRDPKPAVYCIKEIKRQDDKPFQEREVYYHIAVEPIFEHRWNVDTSRASAFTLLWQYPNSVTPLGSVLATLRAGDEISFRFGADDHSSPWLLELGIYGDVLALEVRRNGKLAARWDLEVSMRGSNARMIKGTFPRVEEVKAIEAA
jgi:hypothetical protein